MTPEQTRLKELIDAVPSVSNGALPAVVEDERYGYKAALTAVKGYMGDLKASGKLADTLNISAEETGGVSLKQYAAEKTFHQLTDEGNIWGKPQARTNQIPGIPGHGEQRAAFVAAADFRLQDSVAQMFLENLKNQPGAAELLKDDVRVLDIGYHNGTASAAVAKSLLTAVSPDKLQYDGMELLPQQWAQKAAANLGAAGVKPENINLMGGKLGFQDATLHEGIANEALKLPETPDDKKYKITLALNLYNMGDQELFWKQVDNSQAKEGITLALHDSGGDLMKFKQDVNAAVPGTFHFDAPKTEAISTSLKAQDDRPISTVTAPYTLTFPQPDAGTWEALKSVQTGVFDKPYEQDVAGTNIDPQKYKQFRLLTEFVMGGPLAASSQEQREVALDTLKSMLEQNQYKIKGTVTAQVAPSRGASKELVQAVEAAAQITQQQVSALDKAYNAPEAQQAQEIIQQGGNGPGGDGLSHVDRLKIQPPSQQRAL